MKNKKMKQSYVASKDENGHTPLFQAAFRDNVEKAGLLISEGADVNTRSIDLETPLHYVKSKEMARLLIENNADVNARSSAGHTPLHTVFTAIRDWSATCSMGSNVAYGDEKLYGLVEYLITRGADVNAKSRRGETCLQKFLKYAEKFELRKEATKKISDLLREHGAEE
jgi:ankyrin repeat protein